MSIKLKLTKEKAIELYPKATPVEKAIFEESYGKEAFITDVCERVQSFRDACIEIGKDPDKEYSDCEVLDIFTDALRKGWTPEFENPNQKKWQPIVKKVGSAFVFTHSGNYYDFTHTACGSRFCQKDKRLSDHFGKIATQEIGKFITRT